MHNEEYFKKNTCLVVYAHSATIGCNVFKQLF